MKLILSAIAILGVLAAGCATNPADESPSVSPLSARACTPSTHATQGPQADLMIQRYRIVATSTDGRRIAVLFSYFGPSSLDPWVRLSIYEEGVAAPLFERFSGAFGVGPDEETLASLERSLLDDTRGELTNRGLSAFSHNPSPLAWCASGTSILLDQPARELTWSVVDEDCAFEYDPPVDPPVMSRRSSYRLCAERGSCIERTTTCGQQGAQLLDVFRFGDIVWSVTQAAIDSAGDSFRLPILDGQRLPVR